MINPGTVERTAVYEAIDILRESGYHAERVATYPKMFDVIAWKPSRTLCLCIRSSRQARVSSFRDCIQAVSGMIASTTAPGDVQFWIYRRPGWSRWTITSGGASPIEQWDVPSIREGVPA